VLLQNNNQTINKLFPYILLYRYDPYERKLTKEYYEHDVMKDMRRNAIEKAKNAKTFGLILGTLGRQGSTKVLNYFHVCFFNIYIYIYNVINYLMLH